jgi:phosphoribosylformimino-5-aminoimidazole carboxamide ribotide isomerase
MIIPCIDLQGGRAVQLVRGRRRVLAVDDILGLLERFRRFRLLHVIDLDAALRHGNNDQWVHALCQRASQRLRVGGGIRNVARAEKILRWGAEEVIIGTAAFRSGRVNHSFLRRLTESLGRRRITLALDAEKDHIVTSGWRRSLRLRPEDVMSELEPYCSGFLCTCVDREGRMGGTDLGWFRRLRGATQLPITAAGGVRSRQEIRALGRLGMHAAVGMALYLDELSP